MKRGNITLAVQEAKEQWVEKGDNNNG